MRRLTKFAFGLLAGCSAATLCAQAPIPPAAAGVAPAASAPGEAPLPANSFPPAPPAANLPVGPLPAPNLAPPGLPPAGGVELPAPPAAAPPAAVQPPSLPPSVGPLPPAQDLPRPADFPPVAPRAVQPIPGGDGPLPGGGPSPGAPSSVPTVGLRELGEVAQENNPTLRSALYAIQAARGRAIQAGLYPNPSLMSGASQLAGSASQYQAIVTQEVVVAHKLQLDRDAILQEAKRLEFEWVNARYQVLTNVRKLYFSALASQERVAVLEQLVVLANQSRGTAERLQKAGEGARVDTILLDIEFQRARMDRENSGALLEYSKRALAAGLGLPDSRLPLLVAEWDRPLPAFEDDPGLREFILRNAQVQAAIVEIARQQTLLQRARVEPIPNVTVMAGYQSSLADVIPNQGMVWLSMPIPTWNRNQGAVAAFQSEAAKALYDSRNAQNDVAGRLAESLGKFIGAKRMVERYRTSILPLAREAFQITRKGYEEGQFDFLRLLQSQKALLEANLGYIQALEDCWVAGSEVSGILQIEAFP